MYSKHIPVSVLVYTDTAEANRRYSKCLTAACCILHRKAVYSCPCVQTGGYPLPVCVHFVTGQIDHSTIGKWGLYSKQISVVSNIYVIIYEKNDFKNKKVIPCKTIGNNE